MKKKIAFFSFLFLFITASALMAAGCDLFGNSSGGKPNDPAPPAPVLEKTNFAISYGMVGDGDEYGLTWSVSYATSYKAEYNGKTEELSEACLPLGNLNLDAEQTVTVRAFNGESASNPVTLKFKGVKLTAPANVRFSAADGIGWDSVNDTNPVGIEYTRLDGQDRPAGAPVQTVTWQYNHSVEFIRSNFKDLDLCDFVQETRVRSLVNTSKVWTFNSDTALLEFDLPSDPSVSSVRILGVGMSNPSNLRWKEPEINPYDDRGVNYFYGVEWEPVSDYKTLLSVHKYTSSGSSSSGSTLDAGVSETNIYLSSDMSGEYRVTALSVNTTVDYLSALSAHRIYVQRDAEEELTFTVNRVELQTPSGVRVDGENIVWDAVENARDYVVKLAKPGDTEDAARSFSSKSNALPLADVYDQLDGRENYNAIYNITVYAEGIGAVRTSFTNNKPVFSVYRYSGYSAVNANARVQLKSIASPKNIQVDKTSKTVSWDAVTGADSYDVDFWYTSGNGTGTTQITNLYYSWMDNVDIEFIETIGVIAKKNYEYQIQNSIPTLILSSVTVVKL